MRASRHRLFTRHGHCRRRGSRIPRGDLGECAVQHAEQEVVDLAGFPEADFVFGGMDIDVHVAGWNFQKQHERRVAGFRYSTSRYAWRTA